MVLASTHKFLLYQYVNGAKHTEGIVAIFPLNAFQSFSSLMGAPKILLEVFSLSCHARVF